MKRRVHLIRYAVKLTQIKRGKPYVVVRHVVDVGDGVEVARVSQAVARILRRAGVRYL
jgi:hypothetical protein